jgi:hypothetical protein
MDERLWSERHGGSLALTAEGFGTLLEAAFRSLREQGLFYERFGWTGKDLPLSFDRDDLAQQFFAIALGDPWAASGMFSRVTLQYKDVDDVFDVIELLHRDVVSKRARGGFDREAGRAELRRLFDPILGRLDPPLELTESGRIVQRVGEPFRRLVEQPLPEQAPKREVQERVDDAIAHFRRRDARPGDRRAAVRELADVLEFLRKDVKEHLLSEDERALFRLANEFAIRHNKRETRRDFDDPAWLAWAFYVYLATVRVTLELAGRQEAP